MVGGRKKKFEKRKSFEVDLRIRDSLTLIPYRKIETLELELID